MANLFKRFISANVGTTFTATGSYTVPAANVGTVIGLSIANTANVGISVDARLGNSTANVFIVKSAPIPVGGTLVIIGGDQKVVLQVDDSIFVKSDTATSVDAILSLLESTQ
jgi:hypothetical protein